MLGHAHSGTTILGRLLNSSDDVMLGEAHVFESYWNAQFVTDFNGHHQRTKKVKSKGTRLPAQFAGMLPEAILKELGWHYRWVGEKIAIGPMSGLGARAASHALDYYQAYQIAERELGKNPPQRLQRRDRRAEGQHITGVEVMQGWMLSLIEIGAASNILKHVHLVPMESMSIDTWERLQRRLGVQGRADAHWIDPAAKRDVPPAAHAALAAQLAIELGWQQQRAALFLARLSELYGQFLAAIVPDTFYFTHSVSFADQIAQKLLGDVQDMAAQLAPPAAMAQTLPASVCAWSRGGAVHHDRRVLPLPRERMQRFSGVLRDSLFHGGALALLDEQSGMPLLADGLDMLRDGPWLRLNARAGVGSHKHLTARMPIDTLTVATVRFLLRREAGQSRYFMLQTGDASGFYKSVVDCQLQQAESIQAYGPVKSLFTHIEQLANGNLRIAMSGMLTDGRDSYVRLYLCDDKGAIDFQDVDARLAISDLTLSYAAADCGLDENV